MRFSSLLLIASTLTVATAADAITYVGTRTIGTGSATLSITTDNTIGVIGAANILSYTIGLNNTDGSFVLNQGNSDVLISGSALTATANDLLFDFSAASGFALFQAPSTGSSQTFYCVQVNGCFDFAGPGEAVEATTDFVFPRVARSGNQVIASVGGAVPEPASWAMMIGGFGLAGAALRRRQTKVVFA